MDINDIVPIERSLVLKHPGTGEPLGVVVNVRSTHSREFRDVERRVSNATLRLRQKGKTLSAEQVESNLIDLLVATVSGWEWCNNTLSLNGVNNPPFNETNVRLLVSHGWAREQIQAELEETAAFFGG